MEEHMPHFVGTFKDLFVLGKIFIYVNDIVPLKILVESPGAGKRDNDQNRI